MYLSSTKTASSNSLHLPHSYPSECKENYWPKPELLNADLPRQIESSSSARSTPLCLEKNSEDIQNLVLSFLSPQDQLQMIASSRSLNHLTPQVQALTLDEQQLLRFSGQRVWRKTRKLTIKILYEDSNNAAFQQLLEERAKTRSIYLIQKIQCHFPLLQTLTFEQSRIKSHPTLLDRIQLAAEPFLPNLQRLLGWQAVSGLELAQPIRSHLTHLDMTHCTRISDAVLQILLDQLQPQLLSATLEGTLIGDQGVEALAKSSPQLTHLNLADSKLSDAGLRRLSQRCSQLTHLNLQQTQITGAALASLTQGCKKLLYLNFNETALKNRDLDGVAQDCEQLTHLCIARTQVGDPALRSLVRRRGAQLLELDLSNTGISGRTLEEIAERCQRLESLNLLNVQASADSIDNLIRSCPRLTELDLSLTHANDATLDIVGRSCPELKRLALFHTQISDAGLTALAERSILLQAINLVRTPITAIGLGRLLEQCPHLQRVDLGHTAIEPAQKQVLAKYYPKVQFQETPSWQFIEQLTLDQVRTLA